MTIQLLSTTEIYQFSKLPLLVEHFTAHKAADKDLTMFGFLYEHYIISNTKDPDYAADMQLPFKTHDSEIAINIGSFRFINHPLSYVVPFATEQLNLEYNLYYHSVAPSSCLFIILQPPKSRFTC